MAIASLQRPPPRLAKKYVLVIAFLVGGVLLASGLVELFFSYQESRNALAKLEREEATFAAANIEQFIDGIMLQVDAVAKKSRYLQLGELDDRRVDYLRLLNHVPAITQVALLDPAGK